jgi:hypothetical protein
VQSLNSGGRTLALMFGTARCHATSFSQPTIGDLTGNRLCLRCVPPCTEISYFPLKLMAARDGRRRKLHEAMARLRCAHCGGRPTMIAITDHPNASELGGQRATWLLEL